MKYTHTYWNWLAQSMGWLHFGYKQVEDSSIPLRLRFYSLGFLGVVVTTQTVGRQSAKWRTMAATMLFRRLANSIRQEILKENLRAQQQHQQHHQQQQDDQSDKVMH